MAELCKTLSAVTAQDGFQLDLHHSPLEYRNRTFGTQVNTQSYAEAVQGERLILRVKINLYLAHRLYVVLLAQRTFVDFHLIYNLLGIRTGQAHTAGPPKDNAFTAT